MAVSREAMNDRLEIHAAEGVCFSLPLAGLVTRFLAWGIDLAATLVAALLIGTVVASLNLFSGDVATAVIILAFFVLYLGYSIFFEWAWRGQTPGKRVLGIRVLDAQGLHLQFSQIVIRNLLRTIDALPMGYLIGGVAILLNRNGQRLGDLAADTVVVSARPGPAPDLAQVLPGKYNSFREHPHLEARLRQRVSTDEAGLLIQALMRRDQLDPAARVTLFADLAEHFRGKVSFPEPSMVGLSDEQYLRNIVESLYRTPGGERESNA